MAESAWSSDNNPAARPCYGLGCVKTSSPNELT